MRFEFATATRMLFGPGVVTEAAPAAAALSRRALVVTGGDAGRSAPLVEKLAGHGVVTALLSVAGEPTVEVVREGVQRARGAECDLVVGLGGGSVLDTGKAVAALLTNGGDPLDYLEVIVGAGPSPNPPPRTSPFLLRRVPARKSRATPYWSHPNIMSRPACGAR